MSSRMTNEVPELFDGVKAEMALVRAQRSRPETFLAERLAEDAAERMVPVLRDLPLALDLGTPVPHLREALARAGRVWQVIAPAEAERAEPAPQSLDFILSAGVFHRINDLPGLMLRIRRALRPDGLMLAVFPGGDTLHELRDCLLRAESEITGNAVMRVAPMIDVRAGGQLLQRAGFALPVADSERITVRYSSLMRLVRDLRAMGASASLLRRSSATPRLKRAIFLRAAALYAEHHADGDGKLRATFEFIWLSGWAAHESQQKPLKPGSAKARLADALAIKNPMP